MTDYYHINTHRLPILDVWSLNPTPVMLVALALFKLAGKRVPGAAWSDPGLIEVPPLQPLSRAVNQLYQARIGELERAGFLRLFECNIPPLNRAPQRSTLLLSADRRVGAMVSAGGARGQGGEQPIAHVLCVSRTADDREISTSDAPRWFPRPPWVDSERVRGTAADIVRRHHERIRGRSLQEVPEDRDEMVARMVAEGRRAIAWLALQGVLEPMTPEQVAAAQAQPRV